MADKKRISVREFIEAALQFSEWKCEVCGSQLAQVWIGEESNPDLHYIHCPSEVCEQEYNLIVAFVRDTDIPNGR